MQQGWALEPMVPLVSATLLSGWLMASGIWLWSYNYGIIGSLHPDPCGADTFEGRLPGGYYRKVTQIAPEFFPGGIFRTLNTVRHR